VITFRNLGKLGRFGNQLFQYAGTRLYAELNGYVSASPQWIGTSIFRDIRPYTAPEYLRSRLLPTVQLADMKAVSHVHRLQGTLGMWHQRDIRELYANPQDNRNLYGYLQDPFSIDLLAVHKHTVASWFRWGPHIEQAFRKATEQYAPWAGVHIRRGDFVRLGKTTPTSLFIKELTRQAPGITLFVSSDDASTRAEFERFDPIRPANPLPRVPDFIFDFWMLQNAWKIYGCGSTFSWWAAYLGNTNSYYSPPLTHLWPKEYSPLLERQKI
jgi:hypothetical protein